MKLFFSLLLLIPSLNSLGQDSKNISLGTHKNNISSEAKAFYIDSNIVVYIHPTSSSKLSFMTNYLCFQDTVVFIQHWEDNSLFEEPCLIIAERMDSSKMETLQQYFTETYNTTLNYTDGMTGIIDLKQTFGIKCGAAAMPRGSGEKYLELKQAELSLDQKYKYLTSINPQHALIGYLLLLDSETPYNSTYKFQIENNQFVLNYCYGSSLGLHLTISEIIKDIKR